MHTVAAVRETNHKQDWNNHKVLDSKLLNNGTIFIEKTFKNYTHLKGKYLGCYCKDNINKFDKFIICLNILHNPNPKAFALINTGEVTSNGEHWMGVVINKLTNNSGYFDSFGGRFNWLEEVLKRNFSSVHKTNHVVQSESTQTCGLHTIYFVICMMNPKDKTLTNQNVNMGKYVRKHYDTKSSNEHLKDTLKKNSKQIFQCCYQNDLSKGQLRDMSNH